jgi:arsenate reductase
MKVSIFGIPNCNTVKKARDWLESRGIDYDFQDFKKITLTESLLKEWLLKVDVDELINRKGTTWRSLSDSQKETVTTQAGAIALMIEKPSVIKRPVTIVGESINLGFTPESYKDLFNK